ncbi:LysR family transcriptional regulator [Jiella sp. M17.18]|uniref:LysR family transcriptional regulator n=1 Tax=Jiella sp. M17.18 TaxID=3234247 RepID=UPI0034DF1BAE
MNAIDLNLLVALDALLTEGSVTGAARRLGLSTSATSRTLTRLRTATGDPLLVRAGRGLVPTPRAAEMRERVHALTRDARAVLQPEPAEIDPATLARTFTIRASEAFLEFLSGVLVMTLRQAAPGVRLRFVQKPDKNAQPLRDGLVDLEIGLLGTEAPEIRTRLLFVDRRVGVARTGHELLAGGITPERYAACEHIATSRDGSFAEPIDDALEALGLRRSVVVVVPGFPDAMRIASQSDLVAVVPRSCLGNRMRPGEAGPAGLQSFELPLALPRFNISAIWHPRLDADPAHRWLRDTVAGVCRAAYPR